VSYEIDEIHFENLAASNSPARRCSEDLICDGVVTGIQIRGRTGDIAAYRIIKNPIKPL